MKKKFLSALLAVQMFSMQAFPPIKDIILTTIPVIGFVGGGNLGYWLGAQDKKNIKDIVINNYLAKTVENIPATTSDKVIATIFFSLFGVIITAPFTIGYTSYYKFWKAKQIVNKITMHELFLLYDLSELEIISLSRLFEVLNTSWDIYPLASSFDMLSEWSKKIKKAIMLYAEVAYVNDAKTSECNERIAALRNINTVLVSVRVRIQNSDNIEFDRQMKFFLEEKRIEELRKLQQEVRWGNYSSRMNVHYIHNG